MANTKRHCCRRNSVATDRISTLPHDLLLHVLSFLSTKEAVQTCILAKSWRNTWASVPTLKFNLNEFMTDRYRENDEKRKECNDKFDQFVHGVMENRERSYLDKFQYKKYTENYSEVSMEWLDRVVILMPRVISVFIIGKIVSEMPNLVFSCPSLQKLELTLCTGNQITTIRPKLINLPSLKVLFLHRVDLDNGFSRKLFLGCPALESLNLFYCDLGFSEISSNVLKTLALKDGRYLKQMEIYCPSLISLDIRSIYQKRLISLKNTTSLENADIALPINDILFDDDLNILRCLSNVSTMKLVLYWFDQLKKDNFEINIPDHINFNNLKTLDLGRLNLLNLTKGKNLVAFFLRHSPQLQQLTLRLFKPLEDAPEEPSKEESVEIFQRDYLDTVIITIYAPYCGIVKWKMNDPLLRQMIKYLHNLIKKIGNIITSCTS